MGPLISFEACRQLPHNTSNRKLGHHGKQVRAAQELELLLLASFPVILFGHAQERLRLAALFLPIVRCPFEFARISVINEKIFSTSSRTKVQYCAVVSDVHHPRSWRERFPAEGALVGPRQDVTLPYLLGLTFGLSKDKNVTDSDRPLHVSCYDTTFVLSFEKSDSDLDDFARNAGPTYDLRYFRRGWFFPGFLAC